MFAVIFLHRPKCHEVALIEPKQAAYFLNLIEKKNNFKSHWQFNRIKLNKMQLILAQFILSSILICKKVNSKLDHINKV